MRRHRGLGLVAAVAAVAIAVSGCDKPAAKPDIDPTPSASASPSPSRTRITTGLPKVGMTGAGRYQLGASLASLEKSLQQKETSCPHLTVAKGVNEYADLLVAFVDGKLTYVMVDTPTIATEAGITVGSSMAEVLAAYPQGSMLSATGDIKAMSVHGTGPAGLLIRFNQTESTVATIQAGTSVDLENRFSNGTGC